MNSAKTAVLAILGLTVASTTSLAAGDPVAGQKKSQVCQACHGADGKGTNPSYPVLAGQYADYMEHALKAYRDGGRDNVIMKGIAAPLSDQDIADLSAFYASLEGLKDLSIK